MIKHYSDYIQRTTEIDYLNIRYKLHCEKGIFYLYSPDGRIAAKSCRFPLHSVKINPGTITNTRPENKFKLKRQTNGILALVEISTDINHDYLVLDGESYRCYNLALFVFVCSALLYYDYGVVGKTKMIPDQKSLSVSIDNGYCELQIENNAVIYTKGAESCYAKHIRKILDDLKINQYQHLPGRDNHE